MSERLFSDLGAKAAKDPIQAERERFMNNAPARDSFLDAADAIVRRDQELREATEALKAQLAPPGTFNIPKVLDERRLQHLVPDNAFKIQPLYEWCFAYQLAREDMEEGETWGNSRIIKTETAKKLGTDESPRCLLISAGLGALDTLASHGIQLGDIVFTVRNAPWAIQIATIGVKRLYVRAFRDADIIAGEDLWKRLASGELVQRTKEVMNDRGEKTGTLAHYYETKDGKPLNPVAPLIPDDL